MSINLSEFKTENAFFKGLILGASNAGKTVASITFPGKKLILDFDNKVSSAAMFYQGQDILKDVSVKQYGKVNIKSNTPTIKHRIQQFQDDMTPFIKMNEQKQKLPFDTLIIDTITTLTDSLLEDYREVSLTGVKRPHKDQNSQSDYGMLGTQFKMIMGKLLVMDANVIFLGHTELVQDKDSGIISNEILMPGKMASKLGIYFEEVYFAKLNSKNERVWQTQPDSKTKFCRTQRRNLPAEIPANYAEIVKAR